MNPYDCSQRNTVDFFCSVVSSCRLVDQSSTNDQSTNGQSTNGRACPVKREFNVDINFLLVIAEYRV
jgi:hypothetical protein